MLQFTATQPVLRPVEPSLSFLKMSRKIHCHLRVTNKGIDPSPCVPSRKPYMPPDDTWNIWPGVGGSWPFAYIREAANARPVMRQ